MTAVDAQAKSVTPEWLLAAHAGHANNHPHSSGRWQLLRLRTRQFGWHSVVCCFCVILLLAMRQSFIVPYTGLGQSPALLLMLGCGVVWLLTRVIGQRSGNMVGAVGIAVCCQLIANLIAYDSGARSLQLTADQISSSQNAVVTELTLALFFCFVSQALRTRRQIEILLRCLLIGGALSGLYAIGFVLTKFDLGNYVRLPGLRATVTVSADDSLQRLGLHRPQGAAAHALEFGAVMTLLVPIGLGICFAARRRGERSWPWQVATVIVAAGAVVSLSRSAVIGTAAALIVMVGLWPLRRALTVFAALGAAVSVAWLSGSKVLATIISLFLNGSQDGSLQSRSYGRDYVYHAIASHLWFGQGYGTYNVPQQPVLDNQYLTTMMDSGVIGLVAYAGLLLTGLFVALRVTAGVVHSRVANADESLAELAGGVAGGLMTLITTNLILDTYGFIQIIACTWILLAVVAAMRRVADSPAPLPVRVPDRFALRHRIMPAVPQRSFSP